MLSQEGLVPQAGKVQKARLPKTGLAWVTICRDGVRTSPTRAGWRRTRATGMPSAGRVGKQEGAVAPAGAGWTEAVRAREIKPAPVTRTARPTPAPLSAVRCVVSPSSPTPTARLAMGVTTVMTGSEIIGQPAWYAVWVSRREIGPPMASAKGGQEGH